MDGLPKEHRNAIVVSGCIVLQTEALTAKEVTPKTAVVPGTAVLMRTARCHA